MQLNLDQGADFLKEIGEALFEAKKKVWVDD